MLKKLAYEYGKHAAFKDSGHQYTYIVAANGGTSSGLVGLKHLFGMKKLKIADEDYKHYIKYVTAPTPEAKYKLLVTRFPKAKEPLDYMGGVKWLKRHGVE